MEKRYNNWNIKELAIDLLYDIGGSVLFGLGIYTFALNAGFAPGGVSGLSLMLNYLSGLPVGLIILMLNVPMILFSWKVLGKVFLIKSVKTIVLNSIFLDFIFPQFPVYQGDPFLASIFTGVFVGAACAILYMRGTSTGGVDFLILGIKKLVPWFTVGQITLIIDGIIVIAGGFVFQNIDAVLYGVIEIFVSTVVLDKIMAGATRGKLAVIITKDAMKAAQAISDAIDRGATMVKGTGTYSGKEREMLFCACSSIQVYRLRQVVHQVDPRAMVMITDANEVFGEGFAEPQEE